MEKNRAEKRSQETKKTAGAAGRRFSSRIALLLAIAMTAAAPIPVRADESSGTVPSGFAGMSFSGAASPEAVSSGAASAETISSGTVPAKPEEPLDDGDEAGVQEISADGYELFSAGSGKETLDTLKKGRRAKIVVTVSQPDIRTGEISKARIHVSKLSDSFRQGGSPKVKIVSEKEDSLEYTVTFSKLIYSGKGDELRFKVKYQKEGIAPAIITAAISECEEGGSYDGDSDEASGQPVLKLRRVSPQNPVGAGESFPLVLEVENTSRDSEVEDLVISAAPGGSLFLTDDTNTQMIQQMGTRSKKEIRLNLTAGQDLAGPSQILELELKYNYYSGGRLTSGSSSQKVLIPVRAGSAAGQPLIRISRSEIGPIRTGESFQTIVHLENTSREKGIRNLIVTFEPTEQISLMEPTDTKLAGDLEPGQAVDLPLRLKAGAELGNAASQLLGVSLKFDYDSDKGAAQGSTSEKLVLPVSGASSGPSAPTPNIILKNYSYGEKAAAGQVFLLDMELANTSLSQPVENVVMSLETGEGLSINSSSNTFYIPKLEAGQTKKESVQVQALFQSKLQSPKITISFRYEYLDKKERKQSSSTETIAIPVYQPDRMEFKSPVLSGEAVAGTEETISIPYVNKGRGQIFNVEARLEGEIDVLERELTAGNFEAGKSGTLDFVVTPKKEGPFEGTVVIRYEDEAMEVKSVTVPVQFTVQEAEPSGEDLGFDEEAEPPRRPVWWKYLIPAAVPALAACLAAVRWRKKKAEKERRMNGEESYEEELYGEEPLVEEPYGEDSYGEDPFEEKEPVSGEPQEDLFEEGKEKR